MQTVTTRLFAALWTVLGLGLLIDAILASWKWQSDPIYSRVGLAWDWIGVVAGIAALALGVWWLLKPRMAPWFSYVVPGLFALYSTTILIFGDQGATIYRFGLPLAVLVLSVATVWRLWRATKNQARE